MAIADLPAPAPGAVPVTFDVGAARTAIAKLDALHGATATLLWVETAAAEGALDEWTGSSAAWFTDRRATVAEGGANLGERVDATIVAIESAATAAAQEQHRRNTAANEAAEAAAEAASGETGP